MKETPERVIAWGGQGSRLRSRDAERVIKGMWGEGQEWLPFQFIESRTQGEIPRQGEERGHRSLRCKNL